jgi:pyruvate dehydrogenase E2 component (dihydrolipoamide acetyltransferase)
MANPIIMPKLGQMTEESTVVRWLKQEGESVSKGDILLEIETDKATMEVESFYDGVLLKILITEGETVPVMATLGFVGAPGESTPEDTAFLSPSDSTGVEPAEMVSVVAEPVPSSSERGGATLAEGSRLRISPRAAGLALSQGVDARQLRGTGPGGRIIEKDVVAFLSRATPRTLAPTPTAAGENLPTMRRVIAERLTHSYTTTPHFFVTVSVDMTRVQAARDERRQRGAQLSVTDFLVKAVAHGLTEYPAVNASTDGRKVTWRENIDVGIAVALKEGLVVPVVRNAYRLTLEEVSAVSAELVEKARTGKLKPEEMTGSTFTVSNLGMMGVESFTAIINPGESAILAVSATIPSAVVRDGEMTIRPIMKMTLSADHRLIDGALAARFLDSVKERLQNGWEITNGS